MTRTRPGFIIIALIDLVALAVGIAGARFLHLSYLSLALGTVAIVTFFGTLAMDAPASGDDVVVDARLRRAIATAIVTVYMLMVATMTLFSTQPRLEGLLLNFTTTTGIVIAFYFGASAYVEAKGGTKTQRPGEGAAPRPSADERGVPTPPAEPTAALETAAPDATRGAARIVEGIVVRRY